MINIKGNWVTFLIKSKYVVGIMSGTSLDGIDLALCAISGFGKDTQVRMLEYRSYPYPEGVVEKIRQASFDETSSVSLITSLDYELGRIYSRVYGQFLRDIDFDGTVDYVGLHGQTIHHLPDGKHKATMQIGTASHLAFDHQVDVVSNFREMDIAAGGEGAPLVPYTEWILYDDVLLQNIGGIGNITVIPKDASLDDIYAFDTGPGNMMINYATEYFFELPFDEDGKLAAQGDVIQPLLDKLMAHPYMDRVPPKSTGREMFGEDVTLEICKEYKNRPKDVIRTLTEFTVLSIKHSIDKYIKDKHDIRKIVIGGGGAYNKTLMSSLEENLDIEVLSQEDLGLSSDAKEAVAFAILANETMHKVENNVPNATGAKSPVILGQVTFGRRGGDG